eukprot:TRINITY_DN6657_c0_g1_i1.p1 TRINITY_DN6657_c0_g1~~TRINITY_DN6657_c0_g1_i1.p1  ORF type:complete len:183 (-),score=1.84 TRINITY_DN6657_c0_g1_i1:308-856(-)
MHQHHHSPSPALCMLRSSRRQPNEYFLSRDRIRTHETFVALCLARVSPKKKNKIDKTRDKTKTVNRAHRRGNSMTTKRTVLRKTAPLVCPSMEVNARILKRGQINVVNFVTGTLTETSDMERKKARAVEQNHCSNTADPSSPEASKGLKTASHPNGSLAKCQAGTGQLFWSHVLHIRHVENI